MTATVFAVGALSLAGVPGFAGFFSKDLVLTSVEGKGGWVPWGLLMGAAFLTALYMGRVLVKAFLGPPSQAALHAHEPGPSMTGPLLLLAVPAVFAGLLGAWLAPKFGVDYHLHLGLTPLVASAVALLGLAAALVVFGSAGRGAPWAATLEWFDRESFIDKGWEVLYRQVLLRVSGWARWVDRYLVDGVINAVGWGTLEAGAAVRPLQTGRTRHYVFAVMVGALVLAWFGGWR